ncbi:hypothetical protein Tco_0695329, partial [Tanacetum coccineum]
YRFAVAAEKVELVKDQIGTFTYFPSINYQKLAGGFDPIRVNNRVVISVPFPKLEAKFDLLIGDIDDMDITRECGTFDQLDIPTYCHGWIVDTADPQAVVGCEDGRARVFNVYGKKWSRIIKDDSVIEMTVYDQVD